MVELLGTEKRLQRRYELQGKDQNTGELGATRVNLRGADMGPYEHKDRRTEENAESYGAKHTKRATHKQD